MRFEIPTVVAALLVVTVGAVLLFGGATSGAAFGAFNPSWDGTSELRSIADSEGSDPVIVRNTTDYEEYDDADVAFVLAPESGYSDAEAQRVRGFVERGGTIVVADRNSSHSRDLLASVGADARPVGPLLRDERENYRGPALPVAGNVSNHSLVANVSALTLNHGTAVDPNGATVLVTSSEFSYLDRDASGSLGDGEAVRPYPVATVESVGEGRVVVVGDPSVFINSMQGQSGNEAFTRSIVTDTNHTLVDVSRSSVPPLISALLTVRRSALLQIPLGLAGLATVALASRAAKHRRRGLDSRLDEIDSEALAAGLRQRYPSLAESRLLKLTKGVKRSPDEREDDE